MTRRPAWQWIAIAAAVMLIVLAALAVRIMLDRLPDHAQQTIAHRYHEQFVALERHADSFPLDLCEELLDLAQGDPIEQLQALRERLKTVHAWEQQAAALDLLDDPAILGVEIVSSCGGNSMSHSIKPFESDALMWTPSIGTLTEELPSVSLWYAGLRRVVRYQDRFPGSPDSTHGFRVLLDADRLDLR